MGDGIMGQDSVMKALGKNKLCMDDLMTKTKTPRSTLHFELERLENKGLIRSEKMGKRIYYSVAV